jgi:DNA-binding response OmpR family regulator
MLGPGGFRGHGRRRRTVSSPSAGSFRKLEVVLLDLSLDSAHQFLICEHIRAAERSAVILILSNCGSEEEEVRGYIAFFNSLVCSWEVSCPLLEIPA